MRSQHRVDRSLPPELAQVAAAWSSLAAARGVKPAVAVPAREPSMLEWSLGDVWTWSGINGLNALELDDELELSDFEPESFEPESFEPDSLPAPAPVRESVR